MSWSRCSSLLAVLFLTVALAGPATAVTVSDAQVVDEKQVGERITAEFTLQELYQNPQTGEWTLNASTELRNPTWTVVFIDQQGNQVDIQEPGGQNVSVPGVNPDDGIAEVRVSVTGNVPPVESHSYPDNDTFLVAELEQVRQGGTLNTIDSYSAVHYTEQSRAARQAIADAEATIQEAESEGVDVSGAKDNLALAKSAYTGASSSDTEDLQQARNLAENAEGQAADRLEEARQTRDRNRLLLFGGGGLVALLVVVGLVYWYLSNRQTADKLAS